MKRSSENSLVGETSKKVKCGSLSDSSSDEELLKLPTKKKKSKKTKRKYSESSSSDSDHKKKKQKKKHKKEKKEKKKKKDKEKKKMKSEEMVGPEIPQELIEKSKKMAPMTEAEWEKKQSVLQRVYDPETGRTRLIRGSGEILEEIVSKDMHKQINKQATKGDGDFFQATLSKKYT